MPLHQQFEPTADPQWHWGDPSQFTALPSPDEEATPQAQTALAEESNVPGSPWLDVVVGLGIFAIAQLVVGLVVVIVYMMSTGASLGALANPDGMPSALNPILMWATGLSTIAMAWGWAHVGNRTPYSFMRWNFKPKDLLWGLGIVVASGGLGFGLTALMGVSDADASNLNAMIWPANMSLMQAIMAGIAVGVVIPIAEEMVFRGIILNALDRKLPSWVALIITTVLFAVPHITNYIFLDVEPIAMAMALLQVTLLGLIIGGAMLKTGRIGPSVFGHIGNNSLVVAAMVLSAGQGA